MLCAKFCKKKKVPVILYKKIKMLKKVYDAFGTIDNDDNNNNDNRHILIRKANV